MTLLDKLAAGRARLADAGLSSSDAAADVDVLARAILGWDRVRLLTSQQDDAPPELEPRFSEWLERRVHREPTAYIVGFREFWGLDFRVTPAVLIPRPETELIVEAALPLLRDRLSPRVADIGTGSGCLAISIATEAPRARVVASDVSREALAIASWNASRHGVGDRVTFVQTSYLDGLAGTFDLIVANPPYVRELDRPALSLDVRHEPEVALFGGGDGLRNVAGVLDTAIDRLQPNGWLVMEFGYGQEDSVEDLVAQRPGLSLKGVKGDLQQIPRTAIIHRQ